MFKSIRNLAWKLGKLIEDKEVAKSNYKPKYDGQWVDKGKRREEDWQWIESKKVKTLRPYYINVFNLEDDYIITVGFSTRPKAIETIVCEDELDLDIKLRYAKLGYECLGNVVISNETG